jgi:hypothetical protein
MNPISTMPGIIMKNQTLKTGSVKTSKEEKPL